MATLGPTTPVTMPTHPCQPSLPSKNSTPTPEHPLACRSGAPSRTRTHLICSPNAEKHPATSLPARPNPPLPETPYPASGNGPERESSLFDSSLHRNHQRRERNSGRKPIPDVTVE